MCICPGAPHTCPDDVRESVTITWVQGQVSRDGFWGGLIAALGVYGFMFFIFGTEYFYV